LKENEFRDLYQETGKSKGTYVKDLQLDTDFELLFPDDYINNVTERLTLYTELNNLKSETELQEFRSHLEDRFGPLPDPAADLLESVRLKWMASALGLEKLVLKNGKFVGYFIADQDSAFYQSEGFGKLLRYVQSHPGQGRLKEKQTRNGLRLLLLIDEVTSVDRAISALEPLSSQVVEAVS
ncbi:MAG: TRCF domain-containing protein, partial [Robiginitalea sp.]|nr:TRCF domain-containing protein [Robiginitalea sp.]